ncbi:Kae1-associated serine/threonine protein kinase [Candidatus Woesearchaeota archaeon]|nr:Kae1-associated serine/threonine protein kinase [Candidatus Woesearchaeota archaeon]
MQKLISQGAEARIYEAEIAGNYKTNNNEDNKNNNGYYKIKVIIKDRFRKTYRHEALDRQLRNSRARREAKVLEKLAALDFTVPRVIEFDDKNSILKIEKIEGRLVKEVLDENAKKTKFIKSICDEIGQKIAFLHLHGIIHDDLTTSNMILANNANDKIKNNTIYFIDFGLSFFSAKVEDKAVDLHLIERALESKHYKIFKDCMKAVVDGYLKAYAAAGKKEIGNQILARLESVKERGRNKAKNVGS